MQEAFDQKKIGKDEANGAIIHLISEALGEAGIIDYRSNYDLGDLVSRVPGLDVTIKNAIAAARKEAFGGKTDSNSIDRRAGPLQHAGDMGALFERRGEPAGLPDEGRSNPDSEENDFYEEPGEGLAAPRNQFRPGGPNSYDNTIGDILHVRWLGKLGANHSAQNCRTHTSSYF
jgi:hypothetical protein